MSLWVKVVREYGVVRDRASWRVDYGELLSIQDGIIFNSKYMCDRMVKGD